MRFVLIVLLSVVFCTNLFSQRDFIDIIDLVTKELAVGNKVEKVMLKEDGELKKIYTFNKNGQIISEEYLEKGEHNYLLKYNYNDEGLLFKIIGWDGSGEEMEETIFTYGVKGNVIKELYEHILGMEFEHDYGYDGKGKLIKSKSRYIGWSGFEHLLEHSYDSLGLVDTIFNKELLTVEEHEKDFSTSISTNLKGEITKRDTVFYNEYDQPTYRIKEEFFRGMKTYDDFPFVENDTVKYEKRQYAYSKFRITKVEYTYNKNGLVIMEKSKVFRSGLGKYKSLFEVKIDYEFYDE